jgi:hypothetical protein
MDRPTRFRTVVSALRIGPIAYFVAVLPAIEAVRVPRIDFVAFFATFFAGSFLAGAFAARFVTVFETAWVSLAVCFASPEQLRRRARRDWSRPARATRRG